MKAIINFIGKITGATKLWNAVNGYKTKIGAVSLILSGLAELTQKISALTDFASVLTFVKGLPLDVGWMAILAGIAALGIGHKLEKAAMDDGLRPADINVDRTPPDTDPYPSPKL